LAEDKEVAAADLALAAILGVYEATTEARVPLIEDEAVEEARDLDVPFVEDFDGEKLLRVPLERWRTRLWERRRKTSKVLIRRHDGAFWWAFLGERILG
jgi:hypothetical protein